MEGGKTEKSLAWNKKRFCSVLTTTTCVLFPFLLPPPRGAQIWPPLHKNFRPAQPTHSHTCEREEENFIEFSIGLFLRLLLLFMFACSRSRGKGGGGKTRYRPATNVVAQIEAGEFRSLLFSLSFQEAGE